MSTETMSNAPATEDNRAAALRWIDGFNARDDAAETAARTGGYIAHAPDSIQTAELDSDAWLEFLGAFLEGFPDLHLEVLDSSADEGMVAQRILFTGTRRRPLREFPRRRAPALRSPLRQHEATSVSSGSLPSMVTNR